MELKLGSLGESNYSHPDVLTRRIAKMAKDREEKIRMSRIVNGRIGKIGKPMILNSIFSYLDYSERSQAIRVLQESSKSNNKN
jgi:hypothetical protein